MAESFLVDWKQDDFNTLEKGILLTRHRLHESGLFTDDGLARILDNHPDGHLSINTMGNDTNRFEWREGDRNGVSGETLLELVRQGRFWLNIRKMLDYHPEVRKVVTSVYDELEARSPGFKAEKRSANLLISSPEALVHYHIDLPVNMLWHLRGRKRVWVYPPFDFRFVSQEVIESVCSGEFTDEVPYRPDFDKYALVFDVEPGQLLTWPQMAPHRVNNLEGLNVSLSSEHRNSTIRRRINVHRGNRLLRNSLGFGRSTALTGVGAQFKEAVVLGARLWQKLTKQKTKRYCYPISFKVDRNAPTGIVPIDIAPELLTAPHERVGMGR